MSDTFGGMVNATGNWAMQWAPTESVAMVKVPVSIDGLVGVTRALEAAYGKGLVIRTDQQGIDGWLLVARPESKDVES